MSIPAGYKLVFSSNFNQYLQREIAWGTGWGPIVAPVQWITHTPYGGDFGDAYFTGPHEPDGDGPGKVPPSPFFSWYGNLQIKAYFDTEIKHWRSGMIASVDCVGHGFSQVLGYWEARIYMPTGKGVAPGFWLAGVNGVFKNRITNSAEIDIVEAYGVDMTQLHNNLHVWTPTGKDIGGMGKQSSVASMAGWHTYGCLVNEDFIHFYYDDKETATFPSPVEAQAPLYAMVDFALGDGWPIEITSPSYMRVAYVRCYAAD